MSEPSPSYSGRLTIKYGVEVRAYNADLICISQPCNPDLPHNTELSLSSGEIRQLIRLLKEAIKAVKE